MQFIIRLFISLILELPMLPDTFEVNAINYSHDYGIFLVIA